MARFRLVNGRLIKRGAALALTVGEVPTAGGGVTIADFPDYTFFQRNTATDSQLVTIAGTYEGAPDALEWRLVDWTTGEARTAWQTLVTRPTGGTYSAQVNYPRGGWDKVQVRDSVNTSLTATTTGRMGVGIAGGLWGQSNMNLRPTSYNAAPTGDKRVLYFTDAGAKRRIGNINDSVAANTVNGSPGYTAGLTVNADANGEGFVFLGNLLAQGMNCPVLLIERAVNGSVIESWLIGQTNWTNYAAAIAANGGDIEFALGQIGESNAAGTSIATMKARFATVHAQHLAMTGRTTANFKFMLDGLGIGSYQGSTEGQFGNMRAAVAQYCAENAGAFYSTTGHDVHTSDGVHYHHTGYNKVGRRDAKSLLAALGVGTSAAGPRCTGAARIGQVITLTIAHAGGNALQDGAGGTGTALTGFQIYDDGAGGAAIAISATAITSATSLALTMATTPVGPLRIAYAMMNCPHSANSVTAPTLASIVHDNATYHNSGTLGCPLRPFAAIPVT